MRHRVLTQPMPKRTQIKFCGLIAPTDVDVAVQLSVDAIGLVFYRRSPRFIEPSVATILRLQIPSSIRVVGLFVNETPSRVAAIADQVRLDVIQFHGDETAAHCQQAAGGLPYWRAVRMRHKGDLLESVASFPDAEAFLLDAFSEGYGGSGHRFDWSLIDPVVGQRLIVSGGLAADLVAEAIANVSPWAVDVSSGIQVTDNPRRKSADKMMQFVAAVRQADAHRAAADDLGRSHSR